LGYEGDNVRSQCCFICQLHVFLLRILYSLSFAALRSHSSHRRSSYAKMLSYTTSFAVVSSSAFRDIPCRGIFCFTHLHRCHLLIKKCKTSVPNTSSPNNNHGALTYIELRLSQAKISRNSSRL